MKNFSAALKKNEPRIFFIIVILNALPLLLHKFYLTHDGPSHVYNSVLLRELFFGNDSGIQNVYAVNHELVPNLFSHLLLGILSAVFPIWLAEKIILLLYVIGLPYCFRCFMKKNTSPELFSWIIILPFTFSYFFYYGFYNFILALLPFTLLLALWMKRTDLQWKTGLKIFGLLLLIYFSHIYVFVLALLMMGLFSGMEIICAVKKTGVIFRQLFFLFIISLPLLALTFFFLHHTHIDNAHTGASVHELARALLQFSCINRPGNVVVKFSTTIAVTFIALMICAVINRFVRFRKKEMPLFTPADCFCLAAFILLLFYFTVPDSLGGGMNCLRIQQLMLICAAMWLTLQVFPKWMKISALTVILVSQIFLVYFYATEKNYSSEIEEWIAAGKNLEKNSITIPITFSNDDRWMHTCGYMGATSSRALVYNYESGLLWFPVIWNNNHAFRIKGMKEKNSLCDDRNPAIVWMNKPVLYADHVVVWGKPLSANDIILFQPIDSALQENYALTFLSEHIRLYTLHK